MSERLTANVRARRLHALERAADEQREQLRLHTVELVGEISHSGIGQKVLMGIQYGREAGRLFAAFRPGKTASAPTDERSERKRSPFPWASAVSAVGGLYAIFRWWKQNPDQK